MKNPCLAHSSSLCGRADITLVKRRSRRKLQSGAVRASRSGRASARQSRIADVLPLLFLCHRHRAPAASTWTRRATAVSRRSGPARGLSKHPRGSGDGDLAGKAARSRGFLNPERTRARNDGRPPRRGSHLWTCAGQESGMSVFRSS